MIFKFLCTCADRTRACAKEPKEAHAFIAQTRMADERQDLKHHVAVVTGASEGGIGYETAKSLAARGAHVVLGCRSRERVR